MSDKIKSNDVIDDELFIKVSQNSEAFIKNLTVVEAGLRAILVEAQKVMATTVFGSSADIEKYAEAVLKVAKAQEVLAKVETQVIKTEQEKEKLAQQSLKTQAAATKETERSEKAKLKEAKATAAQTSEYKQATTELNRLALRQMDNAIAGRELSRTAKLVAEAHEELFQKVKKAEEGANKFQRSVGNYKTGFNGLSNSVNQLTRELPAFANSVQTGFMAISNNLPIFFDEISKASKSIEALRAQGEKTPGLFATLAGSIISWGTVLSLAVTALTVYGKDLVEFIANLAKAGEAFELSSKAQSKYYENLTKIIEKRIDAQLKLNVLNKSMTESEARNFKADYDKEKDRREIEKQYNEQRQEVADKYGRTLDEINGKLIDATNKTEMERGSGRYKSMLEQNVLVNQAAIKIEKDKQYALKQLDLQYSTEKEANDKEQENKDEKNQESAAKKAAARKLKALEEQDRQELAKMEELEAKRERARQIMRDHGHNADINESDGIVWWDKENGITLEDHNATVEAIDKLRKEKKAKAKKDAEERKKEAKEEFEVALSFIDQLNRAKSDRMDKELSNEIDKHQRNLVMQQNLAAQGLDNTLAFEKEAIAKAELQRQQEARKRERDAKTLAFLKLISSFADKGDDQAVTKAFLQMAIATALTGSFAEGVEGLEGPGTETSDSILARLSKGESVATAAATKGSPGLVTAMNKGKVDEYFEREYLPKYMVSHDVGSFSENAINSLLLQEFIAVKSEMKDIKKIIKERPTQQTDLTPLGDIVDRRVVNGVTRITTKKNKSPLNYL